MCIYIYIYIYTSTHNHNTTITYTIHTWLCYTICYNIIEHNSACNTMLYNIEHITTTNTCIYDTTTLLYNILKQIHIYIYVYTQYGRFIQ